MRSGGTNAVSTERHSPIRFFSHLKKPGPKVRVQSKPSRRANSEISRPSTNRDRSSGPSCAQGLLSHGVMRNSLCVSAEVTAAGIHGQITKAAVGQRNAPSNRRQIPPAREAKTVPVPMPLRVLPLWDAPRSVSTCCPKGLPRFRQTVQPGTGHSLQERLIGRGARQPDEGRNARPRRSPAPLPRIATDRPGQHQRSSQGQMGRRWSRDTAGPHPEPPLLLMRRRV